LALVLLAALASCQKKMEEPGGTGAEKLANEWWVTLTQNGADVYDLGHFKITTYNPATGTDSLWIDDDKNGYGFKTKVAADWNASTFGSAASNLYFNPASPASFPQTVTIVGGKVLAAAGRSRTGNVTDSICMTVEFSDDPGTQFVLSGHARTMFAEDEY
ncbi:MAG: hypothetical protein EOO16_25435, partial [Chitinophagaceae bacterium]